MSNMLIRLGRRLHGDQAGVTALEFAAAGPVLIILLVGIMDIGHMAYVDAALEGAVKAAARDGTLEGADVANLDEKVTQLVSGIAPGAIVEANRRSYYDFTDIERPEAWNDADGDGSCDNGEIYTDENGNKRWDADIGVSGNGGANDVVLYTVDITYHPLFPIPGLTKSDNTRTITAKAVKKNQPYSEQDKYGSAAGACA